MHRHVLRPAARAGLLAVSAAAVLTAMVVSPAGAAPGHPAGAAPVRQAGAGGERGGGLPVPYREFGPPGRPVPAGTPEHTLTVKATNLAGKPDTGGVIQLFNIDGLRLPLLAKKFEHGVATFKVPAGHYFGLASFTATTPTSLHTVVLPQVNVAGNTTVTVQETAASSKLTVVTPRPATVIDSDVWFLRTGASGPPISLEGYFRSGEPLWFSPTTVKPTVGTLQMSVNQHLESPPGPGVPYEYTLSFTSPPGLIPPQRHVVTASGLATVTERFYQPVKSAGGWAFNGSFPGTNANKNTWFGFIEPYGRGVKLPGRLTEYAGGTGSARMEWSGQYGPFRGMPTALGDTRLLRPGEQVTDDWGAFPLHPGVDALLTTLPNMFWLFGGIIPSAVRAGNTLQLQVDPFDDSQPGHQIGVVQASGPAQATGAYEIDQNGIKIASGDAVAAAKAGLFYTTLTLSPKPSTIRFALDYTRASKDFPLSTGTRTVWTFRSAPVTGGRVPPGWSCKRFSYQRQGCAAQPMMTLGYTVAHLGLDGAAPAGRQVVHLTVGHLQGAKASKVTKVSESVSSDGGRTWQPAKVTGSGGSYTATFTAPAGVKVTLRTSAADAAGGSVAETITGAYQTGS